MRFASDDLHGPRRPGRSPRQLSRSSSERLGAGGRVHRPLDLRRARRGVARRRGVRRARHVLPEPARVAGPHRVRRGRPERDGRGLHDLARRLPGGGLLRGRDRVPAGPAPLGVQHVRAGHVRLAGERLQHGVQLRPRLHVQHAGSGGGPNEACSSPAESPCSNAELAFAGCTSNGCASECEADAGSVPVSPGEGGVRLTVDAGASRAEAGADQLRPEGRRLCPGDRPGRRGRDHPASVHLAGRRARHLVQHGRALGLLPADGRLGEHDGLLLRADALSAQRGRVGLQHGGRLVGDAVAGRLRVRQPCRGEAGLGA